MIKRVKIEVWGYTAVNAYILCIFVLIWRERNHFIIEGDIGPPIYYLSYLFPVISLVALSLWFIHRKAQENYSKRESRYLRASKVFSLLSWLSSLLPALIVLYVVLHGPDSNYSKKGFIKLVGGSSPPSSVSKIYYTYDDLWLDPTYQLRFDCTDASVITSIINSNNLQECPEENDGPDDPQPKWWGEKRYQDNLKCFYKEEGDNYWYLWYSTVPGTVWYMEFSI